MWFYDYLLVVTLIGGVQQPAWLTAGLEMSFPVIKTVLNCETAGLNKKQQQ